MVRRYVNNREGMVRQQQYTQRRRGRRHGETLGAFVIRRSKQTQQPSTHPRSRKYGGEEPTASGRSRQQATNRSSVSPTRQQLQQQLYGQRPTGHASEKYGVGQKRCGEPAR